MKELLKALSHAKKEIHPIVKGETNPFFKNKYFDINALLHQLEPILNDNGLLLLQPILEGQNGASIVCSKIYHVESGEYVQSTMTLPTLQDPQKMGSAVTYYRRYTLQSLLSLQAEDDDANKASKPVKAPLKKRVYSVDIREKAISAKTPLDKMMKSFEMSANNVSEYIKLLDNG